MPKGTPKDSSYRQTFPEQTCRHCNTIFLPKPRNRGGGKPPIHCSKRCNYAAYAKRWPDRKLKARLKYESRSDLKEIRKLHSRKSRLKKKYGIDDQFITAELEKQSYRCLGCLNDLTLDTARVDHDHVTDKYRGLLCDHCNWALGHAKDNIDTLQRLIGYLNEHLYYRKFTKS